MKTTPALLSALFALICNVYAAPVPLFDGKTFAGWEGDIDTVWRIEDGAFVAGSLEKKQEKNNFLATKKNYADFELTLKWKLEGTEGFVNGGVQFRTKRIPNHHEVSGYQADLGAGFDGALYDESRRKKVLSKPTPEVLAKAQKPLGEWNEYRIRAEGPRIEIWLNGVQTVDYTETEPGIDTTGSVAVSVDAAGKPSFEIHAGSAWDRIAWTGALETFIEAADAIYYGTLGQRGEQSRTAIRQALSLAKTRGILRVLDVNLRRPFYDAALIRESIAQASVLKLSDDELPEVASACGIALDARPEATLHALLDRYSLDLVAMTRGADGALLVSLTESADQPGIPTVVRDTVGAGDSFTAALVIGLLRGDSFGVIARAACEIAVAVCAQPGAVPEQSTLS